jgi:hypothetical protein
MRNGTKVLKGRSARRMAVATPLTITSHGDPGHQEPASPGGSRGMGQLIDMTEWRLLRPVDSDSDGAS